MTPPPPTVHFDVRWVGRDTLKSSPSEVVELRLQFDPVIRSQVDNLQVVAVAQCIPCLTNILSGLECNSAKATYTREVCWSTTSFTYGSQTELTLVNSFISSIQTKPKI